MKFFFPFSILFSIKVTNSKFTDLSFEKRILNDKGELKLDDSMIQSGLYYKYLQNWLTYFPMEQILILNGNQLTKEPWVVLAEAERFLRIPNEIGRKERFYFNETKGFYCPKEVLY